jgi:hypothetical protein
MNPVNKLYAAAVRMTTVSQKSNKNTVSTSNFETGVRNQMALTPDPGLIQYYGR